MASKELTAAQTKEIETVIADFIKYLLARKQKIDGRYTGSELTNYMYQTYLEPITPEDQKLLFENILLYLSTFKKHELINLLKGRQKLSAPGLMYDYKNKVLPDFLLGFTNMTLKLSTFKDKDKLADFIEEQASASRRLFLKNTPNYAAYDSKTEEAKQDTPEENTAENKEEIEAEIEKHEQTAMHNYKKVVLNLMLYCNFLKIKLEQDKTEDTKKHIISLEQVHKNCTNALTILDTEQSFKIENLPIPITDLIKYTNFAIHLELETDTRIMQQQNIIPKIQPSATKTKKHISFATKIVTALFKLLDALLTIRDNFKMFLSSKSTQNNKIRRDDEADSNRKNLMLFYDRIQPGMETALQEIRTNVAKLHNLSSR